MMKKTFVKIRVIRGPAFVFVLNLNHLNFEFVSDFDIRISDLLYYFKLNVNVLAVLLPA